jgi:YegS/Rv2252/BmrU family lipid kinase
MKTAKIILNPVAGRGYGARSEPHIQRLLTAEGLDFDMVLTKERGQAIELARQAVQDGYKLIVAAGGDGTVHEVVNGLMSTVKDATDITGTLGTLPVGSGSDFAYNVGMPIDLPSACHRLAHGQVRTIDIGRVNVDDEPPQFFDNTINIGFGGIVTREAFKVKWVRGMALYLPIVLKTIFLAPAPKVTVQYNDSEITDLMMMIVVGNGAREGGGFFCTPDAQPDNGCLDLCIAQAAGKLTQLGLVPRFINGSHVHHKLVTMARSEHIIVTSSDNLIAHADGEMLCTEAHRLEFEILPQRLRVQC